MLFGRNTSAILAAIVLISGPAVLWAKVDRDIYAKERNAAKEVLKIEIESLSVKYTAHEHDVRTGDSPHDQDCHISAKAKVVSVTRSAHGLRPGDVIDIQYIAYFPYANDHRSLQFIEDSQRMTAYLRCDGRTYSPCAGAGSFDE